ncbi:MAG: dehydrogenase E1 component subunit alpha/beta [Myxococcota bacterium]|nr:dehydrogenase E1 component subunit alpha/beta [Myxococcota bacterium]
MNSQQLIQRRLSREALIDGLRNMYRSRRLDDKEISMKRKNQIYFQISGAGHEAILTAAGMALDPERDHVVPYYRDRALMLQLGMSDDEILHASVGSSQDIMSSGRQMPSHWSHPALGVISKSSCTGTQFLMGTGAAEASWYRERVEAAKDLISGEGDEVVLVTSGDGTTSEGEFFEALNTACNKQLPVIFLIEDNGYAISVPVEVQTAGGSISALTRGFPNLERIEVDGCDLEASYMAMRRAVSWCRTRKGPALVHAKVIRPYSHSMSDDESAYKSSAQRIEEQSRDPIVLLETRLLKEGLCDAEEISALKASVDRSINEAEARALLAPTPSAEGVYKNIYSATVDPRSPAFESAPVFDESQGEKTMVDLLNACLRDEMARDPRMMVFGEDVADASRDEILDQCKGKGGVFKVTHGLQRRFGADRVYNSPLAEANIVGRAIGMAKRGLRPVVEIQFLDYIWPAFQQIRSELATSRWLSGGRWTAPVVIRTPSGGYLRGGGPYHSQSAESFFAHIPGLRVVMPSNAVDANGLLRTAIRCDDPVIFLEPKHLYRQTYNKGLYPGPDYMIPFGKARQISAGDDLTVVTYGALVHRSTTAIRQLKRRRDCSIDFFDLRSLSPYDWEAIERSVKRTGRFLIVHEETEAWGYGAELVSRVASELFEWLDAPPRRVAAKDSFVGYHPTLEEATLPQVGDVEAAIEALLQY